MICGGQNICPPTPVALYFLRTPDSHIIKQAWGFSHKMAGLHWNTLRLAVSFLLIRTKIHHDTLHFHRTRYETQYIALLICFSTSWVAPFSYSDLHLIGRQKEFMSVNTRLFWVFEGGSKFKAKIHSSALIEWWEIEYIFIKYFDIIRTQDDVFVASFI